MSSFDISCDAQAPSEAEHTQQLTFADLGFNPNHPPRRASAAANAAPAAFVDARPAAPGVAAAERARRGGGDDDPAGDGGEGGDSDGGGGRHGAAARNAAVEKRADGRDEGISEDEGACDNDVYAKLCDEAEAAAEAARLAADDGNGGASRVATNARAGVPFAAPVVAAVDGDTDSASGPASAHSLSPASDTTSVDPSTGSVLRWHKEEVYSDYEDMQRRSNVNHGGGKLGDSTDILVNGIRGHLKVNGGGIWKLHGPAAEPRLNVNPGADRVGFRVVAAPHPGPRDFRDLKESTKIEDEEAYEMWKVESDKDSELFIILPKFGVSPAAACASIGSHLRVGFEDVPASRGHGNFVKYHLDSFNLGLVSGVAHEVVTACSNLPGHSNVHLNEHGMPGFEGGDKGSTAHADTVFTKTKTGEPIKVRMFSHSSW